MTGDSKPWPLPKYDWFIELENKELYPAKYILGLAMGERPSSYHTDKAKKELRALEYCVVSLAKTAKLDFDGKVKKALADSREARLKRIANANKIPAIHAETVYMFKRNPDIVAEALFIAHGI
jgi:hypothetical protein